MLEVIYLFSRCVQQILMFSVTCLEGGSSFSPHIIYRCITALLAIKALRAFTSKGNSLNRKLCLYGQQQFLTCAAYSMTLSLQITHCLDISRVISRLICNNFALRKSILVPPTLWALKRTSNKCALKAALAMLFTPSLNVAVGVSSR